MLEPLAANVTLGPLAGAVNVTGTPVTAVVTGQPLVLASVTCNGFAKALSSCALCGVPPPSTSSFGALVDGHELAPVSPVAPACASASGLVATVTPPAATVAATAHARRMSATACPSARPPRLGSDPELAGRHAVVARRVTR